MPFVLLVRHGRTTANATGVLAGRTAGVGLDERGMTQAGELGRRLAAVPLAAVVTSPLERCRQTAAAVVASQPIAGVATAVVEPGLTECDYGDWQGRPLADLASEPLWAVVQQRPSEARFPGGESMAAMQARAVAAVRRHDEAVAASHGANAIWVAVSHGDVIKAVVAHALAMHLDDFQRLDVHPASISVLHLGAARPMVLGLNTTGADLGWLAHTGPQPGATVGGGIDPRG